MKNCKFYFLFITAIFIVACGSSGSSTPSTDTVTVTGILNSGTISSSISKATAPAADYTVVAIDNSTNKTYAATTGADGSFSIDLPTNTQFHVSLMTSGSYVGPTVFDGAGSEVNTVIKPTANLDLGAVTVDETNGYARTDTAPAVVDSTIIAVATNGKPAGAGPDVDGKDVIDNGGAVHTDVDIDRDGIPNFFDADEDNDGIRNGIVAAATGVIGTSTIVEQVGIYSNIWVPHGDASSYASHATYAEDGHISMRVMVTPKSGKEDQIASVKCISVPADIANIATMNTGSTGDAIDYPAEHTLWKDNSYNLYKMVTETAGSWIAVIAPNTIMAIGDTFTIRATYTDSTYEDFYLSTSYVLTDWAWITTYDGNTLSSSVGTKTSPASVSTDSTTVVFNKPRDEDNNVLAGLIYKIQYAVSDCSSGTCNVPAPPHTEVSVTDSGGDTLTTTVPTTAVGTTYYVVPVAESADGQRNGEETWFTRL